MAPTFGSAPWQAQAPELAARVAAFWQAWDAGRRAQAIAALRPYAKAIATAPATIRGGAVQKGFTDDAASWLDTTELWGRATVDLLDALQAREAGDEAKAAALLAESRDLQRQARAIRVSPPRNRWGAAQPQVGDGVLDVFLAAADARLQR
ncbi:hypothetical protein [Nonomuraea jabiensis]|uniref:hypothetical protein n=1 Tax=Nonomuraea jabiensis TaxID=882448 RepID=UPI0035E46713